MFQANRRVALLTPLFTAAAAVSSAWLRKHFPGLPTPSQGELAGLEITTATAAAAAALKWLHGHQQWEARLAWAARHIDLSAVAPPYDIQPLPAPTPSPTQATAPPPTQPAPPSQPPAPAAAPPAVVAPAPSEQGLA